MDKKKKEVLVEILFIGIVIFLLGFYYFSFYIIDQEISRMNNENILIEGNKVDLDSMTLRQKIAQMIMVRGDEKDLRFNNLNVGGIFLDRQGTEERYKKLINDYQSNSKIKLLVATDLEGAWSPFYNSPESQLSPYFSEVETIQEANEIGIEHGEILKEIGFNLNFAPVSELKDDVYGGRTFAGTNEEIENKIEAYIGGLQKNVLGTCKHYPGKALEENLHYQKDTVTITKEDLDLFDICLENNISAIMISHQIAEGELNSNGKPSSVSKEVISSIDEPVLIVADEINMRALKDFYPERKIMYIDLINAGENLILDFQLSSFETYRLIKNIEKEVDKGSMDEKLIDESVRRVLIAKGYEVG